MSDSVRTRFAVSPTGFMHVGGVRNAIFDWLVARQNNGQFILRIEDTDQAREVAGSVDHILETLRWLGLDWDEGPEVGGDNGPFFQSQRLDIYKGWAQKLIDKNLAYVDPYTPAELDKLREQAKAAKKPFLFRNYRPENPPKWDGSQPLRFKSDPKVYKWHDEVLGNMHAGAEAVDDFVLIKSDDFPTYNFAHIIDDHLMGITHVIRSQEFIASMPKYLNLYEALDFPLPVFAHLPWIMKPDGNQKLSKRDDAKDVLDYAREGYLPEALLNFIVSLGWNDGTEQEIFSREELIRKFDFSRVQKSGARFDERRLLWMDGHWIRELPIEGLANRAKDFWPPEAKNTDNEYKQKVLELVQERLKYLAELRELSLFFFKDLPFDNGLIENDKQLKKLAPEAMKSLLQAARDELGQSNFSNDDLTTRLNGLLGLTHTKPAVLFSLIRIAVTRAPSSPPLVGTLAVLGKDRSLARLDDFLGQL